MGPDRAVLKRAIAETDGNLSQTAARLGCSRTTLYTWIYMNGLEKFAGIRPHTQAQLDNMASKDTLSDGCGEGRKSGVKSGGEIRGSLHVVPAQAAVEMQIQATLRLPESLWDRMKIEAIRRKRTVSSLAIYAFEAMLEAEQAPTKRKGKE